MGWNEDRSELVLVTCQCRQGSSLGLLLCNWCSSVSACPEGTTGSYTAFLQPSDPQISGNKGACVQLLVLCECDGVKTEVSSWAAAVGSSCGSADPHWCPESPGCKHWRRPAPWLELDRGYSGTPCYPFWQSSCFSICVSHYFGMGSLEQITW